ncbi:alpha/beta fold hydrolase [Streptomyces sp. NPDC004752]
MNGALHAYQEVGDHDAPPIILLHGGRGNSDVPGTFAAFQSLGDEFRVIAYQRRGLGESETREPLTVDQLVEDLESLRSALVGSSPATLIGISFGAQLAMMHALRYQGSVSRLVLIGGTASDEFVDLALAHYEKRAHQAPMATRDMVERFLRGRLVSDTEHRMIMFAMSRLYNENTSAEAALRSALMNPVNTDLHARLYLGKSYDIRDRLPSLRIPALVMCGEDDWVTPPACSAEIADLIESSELVVMPKLGHTVQNQANEEVIGRIRTFLTGDK